MAIESSQNDVVLKDEYDAVLYDSITNKCNMLKRRRFDRIIRHCFKTR